MRACAWAGGALGVRLVRAAPRAHLAVGKSADDLLEFAVPLEYSAADEAAPPAVHAFAGEGLDPVEMGALHAAFSTGVSAGRVAGAAATASRATP